MPLIESQLKESVVLNPSPSVKLSHDPTPSIKFAAPLATTSSATYRPGVTAKPTTELSSAAKPIAIPTIRKLTKPVSASFTCDCGKTCPHMECAEAQYQLNTCGCSKRDADHDGIACDTNCQ